MQKNSNGSDLTEASLIKLYQDSISSHQQYVQRIYGTAITVGAVLVAIVLGSALFMFGEKRIDLTREFEQDLDRKKGSLILDYKYELTSEAETLYTKFQEASERAADEKISELERRLQSAQERFDQQSQELVSRLETSDNLPALLDQLKFPSGFIAIFDRVDCPNGWALFESGTGRVLLGANRGEYPLASTGGSARVALKVSEMPAHAHAIARTTNGPTGDGHYLNWKSTGPLHNKGYGAQDGTSREGGGEPHENLPPYVAVTYCKKT